jgi:hypothetical protein
MGLREWIKRMERATKGDLESFELVDGSRYYFDRLETHRLMFMHWIECAKAGNPYAWPPAPGILQKLCEAREVDSALEVVASKDEILPYDRDLLITERRLEPRSLVAGRDVYDQVVEDLSE